MNIHKKIRATFPAIIVLIMTFAGFSEGQIPTERIFPDDAPENTLTDADKYPGIQLPLSLEHPDDEFWSDQFGIWGTLQRVNTILEHDNAIYVGGPFTRVGFMSGFTALARWKGGNWQLIGEFETAGHSVRDMAVDSQGNIYVGGTFTKIDDIEMNNVAMWDGTSWHNLGAGMDNTVHAIAINTNGTVYAGGSFESADGKSISYIAEWDGNEWHSLEGSPNNTVLSIEPGANGDIYVGGLFTHIDVGTTAVSVNQIARYGDHEGSNFWFPIVSGFLRGVNGVVYSLHYVDGDLYVGGDFSSAGPVNARSIAKFDTGNNSWTAYGDGLDGRVHSIATSNTGQLYAGGWFVQSGNETVRQIAGWNGSQWEEIGGGSDQPVYDILWSQSGELLVGGNFTMLGEDFKARKIARWRDGEWHPVGGEGLARFNGFPGAFISSAYSEVEAITEGPDGFIYAGGAFEIAGGRVVNHIVRWDGFRWHAMGKGADDVVRAIAVDENGAIYIGGDFSKVYQSDGTPVPAANVAKWENGSWHALPGAEFIRVRTMAAKGNQIYVGGRSPGNRSVKMWDGNSWTDFPELDDDVTHIRFGPDGRMYIAGGFERSPVTLEPPFTWLFRLAWLDGDEWQPLRGRGPGNGVLGGPRRSIHAMEIDANGAVYVFGTFTTANHTPSVNDEKYRIDVSQYGAAVWRAGNWEPFEVHFQDNFGNRSVPRAAAMGVNNELILGGPFTQINGVPGFNNIARFNITTHTWEPYGSGTNDPGEPHNPLGVESLLFSPPDLYIGGRFRGVGGLMSHRFASFADYVIVVSRSNLLMQTGESREVTVGLTDTAPAGGVTISLRVDDPLTASVSPASIHIPAGQTTSTQPLIVTGRNPGETFVHAEANGFRKAAIHVRVGADLLVKDEEYEFTERDEDFLIQVPVYNQGADAGAFEVVLLEEFLQAGAHQTVHSRVRVDGLGHMESVDIAFPYRPTELETNLSIVVDADNEVDEYDLTNNKVSRNLILPRLRFTDFQASIDAHPDPDTVGRFYTDLGSIENVFTVRTEPGVQQVEFLINSHSELLSGINHAFSASWMMNELPEDDHELTFIALNKFEIPTDTLSAFVQVRMLPNWMIDGIGVFWDQDWLDAQVIGDEVTFTLVFGIGGENGPLQYSASVSDDLEDLQLGGTVKAETEMSLEVVIPLDPSKEWKATGVLTLNQEFFGGTDEEPPIQITVVLTEETLERINAHYNPGSKTLLKRSLYKRYPILPGINAKVGGGFDLQGRLRMQVVGGVVDDVFHYILTEEEERTNVTPGLDLKFKLVGGVEVLFGLLSGQLVLTPEFALDVGATYITFPQNQGLQFFASGTGSIGWKLVASAFYGAMEENIASGNLGPWQIFDTTGDPGKIVISELSLDQLITEQIIMTQSIEIPQILPVPVMTADHSGRVMVAWLEKEEYDPDGPPQIFYSYSHNGEDFSTPQTIVSNEFYKSSPDVRFHPDGTAVAVWVQNSQPKSFADSNPSLSDILRYQDIYFATWDGNNWSSPAPVTPETQGNERGDGVPAVAVSPDGQNRMVLWTRNVKEDPLDREGLSIFFSHIEGNTIHPFSALTTGSHADLAVRGTYVNDSTVVAIWLRDGDADAETTDQYNIYYAVWNGDSWNTPSQVTDTPNQEAGISIGTLTDGRAVAAWVEIVENSAEELDYFLKNSIYDPDTDIWSDPEVVFHSDRFIESPTVHVDSRNIISILWEGYYNSFNSDLLVSLKDLREGDNEPWTDAFAITDDEWVHWQSASAIDPFGNKYIVNVSSNDSDENDGPKKTGFHGPLNMFVVNIQDNLDLSGSLGFNEFFIGPNLSVDESSFALRNIQTTQGYQADVDVTIRNIGAVVSDETIARFFDGDPDNGGNQTGNDLFLPSLRPGQEATLSKHYDFSETEVLYILLDPESQLVEQTRDYNLAFKQVPFKPDLSADSLAVVFDGNPEVGKSGEIYVRIINSGHAPAHDVRTHILDGQSRDLSSASIVMDTVISAIVVGQTVELRVPYTVQYTDLTHIFVSVDPLGVIDELSRDHNVRITWFRTLPDIMVESVWFDPASVAVNAVITNIGNAPAFDFEVDLYRGHPLRKGVQVDQLTVEELAMGHRDTLVFHYNPPEGRSDLYVWANREGVPAEMERDNNRNETSVMVPGVANLTARLDMVTILKEMKDVSISYLIKNQGSRAASGFEYEITALDDKDLTELVKRKNILLMNAGEAVGDTLDWNAEDIEKLTFFLQVDPSQLVPDADRSANFDSLEVIFTITESDLTDKPVEYMLRQNYPNPFNSSTIIEYGLPVESSVNIQIYNVLGQRVATIVDNVQQAGMHRLQWNAQHMASGVYIVVVDFQAVREDLKFRETIKTLYLR